MNVVIYESFVGIVSDFDCAKSGISDVLGNDFIFIANQTKNRKPDSNERQRLPRGNPTFSTLFQNLTAVISYLDD